MDITLRDVLINYNSNKKYDNDYLRKVKNDCYDLEEQIDLHEVLKYLNDNEYLEELFGEINTIKKEKLYPSFIHGYFHNERVLFYVFLIGKLKGLSTSNMRILLDAAKYHDIGRRHDLIDDAHGFLGSCKVAEVVSDNPFYDDEENLDTLKYIIECHSVDDSFLDSKLGNYNIKDVTNAKFLASILKDADGLDRVRISMGKNKSNLDINFLRNEEAKKIVKMAHQLNELYLNTLKKKNNQNDLDKFKENKEGDLYLHSVGVDFFKMESILQNGILSKNKLKEKEITSSKRFDGCNIEDFVSVAIYGDEFYSEKNAYQMHIQGEIIFCIEDVNAIEGLDPNKLSFVDYQKIKKTVPINAGGYRDERFVKDEIPVTKITDIIIPKRLLEMNLANSNINYISDSVSLDPIESQIIYYLKIINKKMFEEDEIDIKINDFLKTIFDKLLKENETNINITKYLKIIFEKLLNENQTITNVNDNLKIIIDKLLRRNITENNIIKNVFDVISFKLIEFQINFYAKRIFDVTGFNVDTMGLVNLIKEARKIKRLKKESSPSLEMYQNALFKISRSANIVVRNLIGKMYQTILNKQDVMVKDVIEDILKKNGLSISSEDENHVYIKLGETRKLR